MWGQCCATCSMAISDERAGAKRIYLRILGRSSERDGPGGRGVAVLHTSVGTLPASEGRPPEIPAKQARNRLGSYGCASLRRIPANRQGTCRPHRWAGAYCRQRTGPASPELRHSQQPVPPSYQASACYSRQKQGKHWETGRKTGGLSRQRTRWRAGKNRLRTGVPTNAEQGGQPEAPHNRPTPGVLQSG
jgi:hypothetical protein